MTMEVKKFLKGDTVKIRPEFQDDGDDEFTWVVLNDEERGAWTSVPLIAP